MSALELFTLAVLVSASAFLATSEIALFSLSRFQIRSLKERDRNSHRKIKKLLSDPGGLLITILLWSEVLNIAISTLITRAVSHASWTELFGVPAWVVQALLGTLVSAPILMFFCEITPKTIGAKADQLIAPLVADPISFIYDICRPIRAAVKQLIAAVSRRDDQSLLKESDFLLMVEEGHKEGTVHASEVELIKNVFEFDDTTVNDVFVPMAQVRSLPIEMTAREALTALKTQRFSRIPVTIDGKKKVVGILYSKDLLRAKLENEHMDDSISELMLDPVFVTPTMKINALFRRFKQQKTHMAIVQNHSGDALGVITMSDVLDILFDDLFPEDEE